MPAITRNSVELFYLDTGGDGVPVVLHHPLTAASGAFRQNGVLDTLVAAGFRCIAPDSIAHGKSGRSIDSARYRLSERVADVLAIADDAGVSRFHFVGYSMGGWIGTGLLESAAPRLLSAHLAGWDVIEGGRHFTSEITADGREKAFRALVQGLAARQQPPQPVDDEALDGLVHCYMVLFEDVPNIETLGAHGLPLSLYCGLNDPYEPNVREAAKLLGATYRAVDGDHMSAFASPELAAFALEGIRTAQAAQLSN